MIVSRRGAPALSHSTLAQLLEVNPHGGGIVIAGGGQLRVRRQRELTAQLLQSWLAEAPPDAAVLLHLRQATCGPRDEAHVQPFSLATDARCAFAHNGTLAGWGDESQSDSAALAARVLAPLAHAGLERMQRALEQVWQAGNRFALLDAHGQVCLVGEQEGVWRSNAWWSNRKQLF
jgi:predicted glutamine amidotransferase